MAIIHRAKTASLREAMAKFPHFRRHIKEFTKNNPEPMYVMELTREMKTMENPNLIYPVGDPIFIHIYKEGTGETRYFCIQPQISKENQDLYDQIQEKLVEVANALPVPEDVTEIGPVLEKLIDMVVEVSDGTKKFTDMFSSRIKLTQEQYDVIKYMILRNRVGYGMLDPIFSDPYLEDIHCTGVGEIMTIHKIFDMVYTNITFDDDIMLNRYIIDMSERVERPASDSHSVVDAVMPDGSRANFIYGRDVSLEGSSFTLRKFSEVPVSITQIINWGTMSAECAAYLWICLENGMNLFVCGETASGKTTTLNAISTFIKPLDKVYTVENTPEVTMPHDCWQHLLTRESGKRTDVSYQDLLIASLRSRPNYIIVGEIRGEEGNIAFQAMQTGHPVMSTFHAGDPKTMIQRVTSPPINVPIAFVDNLNICLIQQAVSHHGHMIRRVLSITELERFYAPEQKMVTRQVFEWDPVNDVHNFRGLFNSYVLESKIARMIGMSDTRKIYDEINKRKRILQMLTEHKIFNYFDVWEIIKNYHFMGIKALPFEFKE
ncbi:MAG: type II/IV secretion system ATPase subunit [Nanoarchaeota archaeon]